MSIKYLCLLPCLFLSTASATSAVLYKCETALKEVRYQDLPCPTDEETTLYASLQAEPTKPIKRKPPSRKKSPTSKKSPRAAPKKPLTSLTPKNACLAKQQRVDTLTHTLSGALRSQKRATLSRELKHAEAQLKGCLEKHYPM